MSTNMSTKNRQNLQSVMTLAWSFVKKYGLSMSEALIKAWRNIKLKARLVKGIVEFRYQKMDGTIRQAWGTLADNLVPATVGSDRRRSEDCQTYFDQEKGEWRCFKKVNLIG